MKNKRSNYNSNRFFIVVSDIVSVAVCALFAFFILKALHGEISDRNLIASTVMSSVCCCVGMFILGVYNCVWRYFGAKQYLLCCAGIIGGFCIESLFVYALRGEAPLYYYVIYAAISMFVVCGLRRVYKFLFSSISKNERKNVNIKRTMIIGAGRACETIINEIHNARQRDVDNQLGLFDPVCIVDDNKTKIGTKVKGVMVLGTTDDIAEIVEKESIEQIIFAIPSTDEDTKKAILNKCSETNLPVRIVPFIGNLIMDAENTTILNKIRDIKIEDLLGRKPITFDSQGIRSFVNNKVCMVTGGGGSIGSEIVRQIAHYDPKLIVIVDIYENNAYDIQQELRMDYGSSLQFKTLIASVRDYHRMNQIFEEYRPEIVFHAAAHKHVPLMESSPAEAIKNNVLGTFNVATLALAHDVKKFVMISTDKAVNPTNVMGASKRCCEMIIQYLAQQPDSVTDFITTRFGNVLGSNGSVIPLFKKQIEQGKPVTVTHPDIIRYFMTIPEAVNLVLEAAVLAQGGEIFVLDMGKPVRIVSLAENLIRLYGKRPYKDVEIKFTGLRPGEKIKEELLMNEEGLEKTTNDLIFIGKHIELDEDSFIKDINVLKFAARENDEKAVIDALHRIVPTFITPEEYNTKELQKK